MTHKYRNNNRNNNLKSRNNPKTSNFNCKNLQMLPGKVAKKL